MSYNSDESHRPPYQYRNLGSSKEIRILVLQPALNHEDKLRAKIVHRTYPIEHEDESGINYWIALSYTWGTDEPTKPLSIDSTFPQDHLTATGELKITPNVDAMLRHIRDKHEIACLWIDAICLNQSSRDEKQQQVPMMEWIYRFALQVVVWLGEDDGTAQISFNLLRALAKMPALLDRSKIDELGTILGPHLGNTHPNVLDKLFQRPWFGRRWILQEIALARDCVFCCERKALPWKVLRTAMEIISNAHREHLGFMVAKIVEDDSLQVIRTMLRLNRVSGSTLDLLWDYHMSACKEKHDIIYAITGLTRDGLFAPADEEVSSSLTVPTGPQDSFESIANTLYMIAETYKRTKHLEAVLKVDYTTPWSDVFTQVASYFIRRGSFAAITRHLFAFGSLHDMNADWPSWVPNWTRVRRPEPKGGMDNVVPFVWGQDIVDKRLRVHAKYLSTVELVVHEFPCAKGMNESLRGIIYRQSAAPGSVPEEESGEGEREESLSASADQPELDWAERGVGESIRCGLNTGMCKPVAAEQAFITDAFVANFLSASAIAKTIFYPNWRPNLDGLINGIKSSLEGVSIFRTSDNCLGLGLSSVKPEDQIVSLNGYHGLPALSASQGEGMSVEAAAIVRPLCCAPFHPDSARTLIGPCILVRKTGGPIESRQTRTRIFIH